jgi:tetratricopeptide (TPR) repeat protein
MEVDTPTTTTPTEPPTQTEETPETYEDLTKSLLIPLTTTNDPNQFIEIFPEEISSIQSTQLATILKDEKAPLSLWTDAALLYMTHKSERDSTMLLSTACSDLLDKQNLGNKEERTRILAAAGIGYLTQSHKSGTLGNLSFPGLNLSKSGTTGTGSGGNANGAGGDGHDRTAQQQEATDHNEELRGLADNHFTRASKLNQLFPMTWIGRGMLNLSIERFDQAKFFFETTLKHCGMVLPALLGMACVYFKEGDYQSSLEMYGKAITLFPNKSGASARVGLGMACYKLGQVDRAKKAFQRAHAMDDKNVEAMVGIAVLDVATLDETLAASSKDDAREYRKTSENAMRLLSTANYLDNSNAMVQNHLANYYFKKWTTVTGVTVSVKNGSVTVNGSGPVNLDPGDRIRIGFDFETDIVGDDDDDDMLDDDNTTFRIKDAWKSESAGKCFQRAFCDVLGTPRRMYIYICINQLRTFLTYLCSVQRWIEIMEKRLRSRHRIGKGSIFIHNRRRNPSRIPLHPRQSLSRPR